MADLLSTEMPQSLTTLEQIAAWVGITMAAVHVDKEYLLTDTTTEKAADIAILRAADGTDRLVCRFSIPLDPNYTTPTTPLWTYAAEIAEVTIPTRFKNS